MRIRFAQRLRRGLGRLFRTREGSVATIFAIAMVPVMLAAGVGLDMSRAMQNRQNLQDALDSTALALAHLPSGTTQTVLDQKAAAWLNANLNANQLGTVTLVVHASTSQIVLDASAAVPTTLTAIAGYRSLPITAHSTVSWGVGHVEVALVLDNTGSMAQHSKMTNLISSAKTLVTTLLAANTTADPSAVKIAIVPFSNTVNIGSTYQTATWMDPTASAYDGTSTDLFNVNPYNGSAVNRFTLFANLKTTWGGCVETRPQWVNGVDKSYDVTDAVPSSANPGTQIVPYFAPDEPDDQNWWGDVYANNYLADGNPTTGSNWDDKQGNILKYQTSVSHGVTTYPTWTNTGGSGVSGYNYGPNFGCGVQPIQRLTNSQSTLTTLINKMVAVGDTNVPLGLFWGWMALSPNIPFADGVAYNTQGVTKIVIILTDGANNSSKGVNGSDNSYYSGVGYLWQHLISTNGGSFADADVSMNDREAKICANMKAKGIVIFAVPLEVTDTTAKTLLQNCASSTANYLNVTSSSDLADAFDTIAGSIGNIRIAQ